jgi:acetyltransferase-like isoleucine patch superfamily enzyme
LEIFGLNASNITNTGTQTSSFIQATFGSTTSIVDSTIQNMEVPFVHSRDSSLVINTTTASSITTEDYVISVDQNTAFVMSDCVFYSLKSTSKHSPIILKNTLSELVKNVTISNITQTAAEIETSTLKLVDDLKIANCSQGLSITINSDIKIIKSDFKNLGTNTVSGGAVYFKNSNLTVEESNFENNIAEKGAGMYYSCSLNVNCKCIISNSSFINNDASIEGGAIVYDKYKYLLNNVTFTNNTALYGPNMASYASKIALNSTRSTNIILKDVPSGQTYDQPLNFVLLDEDDQVLNLDDASYILLKSVVK